MNAQLRRLLGIAATVLVLALVSGCASVETNIESEQQVARAVSGSDTTLVFGKIRWINNENEMEIGTGLSTHSLSLQMYTDASEGRTIGRVGDGGQFAWSLAPGKYRIPAVDFVGPLFGGPGDFTGRTFLEFDVPGDQGPVYIGTLIIETEYKKKFLTWEANTKTETVNDCDSDCAERLAAFGLPEKPLHISLARLDSRLSGLVRTTDQ